MTFEPIRSVIGIDASTKVVAMTPDAWAVQGKIHRKADPIYRYVLANWDLYVFRGAKPFALLVDDNPVSFVATGFNKKPKPGGWGPYANNYLAYTPPQHRGHGYVILLNRTVEQEALRCGWRRSTSLAAGYTGFLYQLKAGRTFWGATEHGELRTDTPLDPKHPQQGTGGVPAGARDVISNPHPMSESELIEFLHHSTKYGQPPRSQVSQVLQRNPLAYNPAAYQPLHRLF